MSARARVRWQGREAATEEFVDTDATGVVPLPDALSFVDGACTYWAVPPLMGLLAAEPCVL